MPELAVIRGEGLCRGNSVVLCFDRAESPGTGGGGGGGVCNQ